MLYIEAPDEVYSMENNGNVKLFLAGGITNCPNWQAEVVKRLIDCRSLMYLTVYNPRRLKFPIDDPKAAEEQITWEYNHLRDADVISFWFSRGSLNPIVLYELGMWGNSRTDKKIVIGIDPEYERKRDVELQTKLAEQRNLLFSYSLDDFVSRIQMHVLMHGKHS